MSGFFNSDYLYSSLLSCVSSLFLFFCTITEHYGEIFPKQVIWRDSPRNQTAVSVVTKPGGGGEVQLIVIHSMGGTTSPSDGGREIHDSKYKEIGICVCVRGVPWILVTTIMCFVFILLFQCYANLAFLGKDPFGNECITIFMHWWICLGI